LLLSTLLLVSVFGHFVYGVFVRHVGNLWLLAVALVWLSRAEGPARRWQRVVFALVCGAHVIAAAVAVPQHLLRPLTRANDVAAWIRAHVPSDAPIVIENDRAGPAVSAYLGGRPLVQLSRLAASPFVVWDVRRRDVAPDFVEANLLALHQDFPEGVFLLGRDRGERFGATGAELVRQAAFDGAVVQAESLWLYVFADGPLVRR
jgi:hypothetical protein